MSQPPIHTAPDEVQAHPHHTGFKTLDLVIALTAIFISGISLFVAFQHGEIEQEMVQASSWPILQMNGNFDTRGVTELRIKNAGVGPAKLENFEVLYKAQPVASVRALLLLCCTAQGQATAKLAKKLSIYSVGNDVLRPGDQNVFIRLEGSEADHVATESFLAASRDITIRACYCSVFDQCWLANLRDLHPVVVKACAAGVVNFNRDEE